MYQPVVLYICFRYIWGKTSKFFNHLTSWISIIAIAIGFAAITIVLSVMNSFEEWLEKNTLTLIPHALLTNTQGWVDPKYIPKIISNNIKNLTPITIATIILQSKQNIAIGTMLGIKSTDPEPLFKYLVNNCINDLINGKYRVILGNNLALYLNVKRGDQIRILTPNIYKYTPIGRFFNQKLFTVIGTFITKNEVDNYQLLINQQDASKIMNYPSGCVTGWRLWLKHPQMVNLLDIKQIPKKLIYKDWREYKGELFQAINMEKNIMYVLFSLIIIIATFNIITSLCLLILEKETEIAILKIQGLKYQQIMLIFIFQGIIIGILGILSGISLGILFTDYLKQFIPFINELPININILQIFTIVFLVIITILLSILFPSWYATTINPIKVLKHE